MTTLDYLIIFLYAAGMLLIGGILSKQNKSSEDMFAASRQSPWWLSGLSAYMSAFSAATFVVWGSIAFRLGMVAVSISMCLGVSSLLVGMLLAGRWSELGVSSAAEYIQIRFGKAAVQFYTWSGMIFKMFAMGVALYSFATMICALMPLPAGHFLADPATGKLSVFYATLIAGFVMLIYTIAGGLWAVLITDAIQFVILMVTVLFVVPLAFDKAGGVNAFLGAAPAGFFSPVGEGFTWIFLTGWIIIHFFKYGGEWVFIQRFLCVPGKKDAQKSSYLFGVLYLVSPIIWMLPPMLYRVIDPTANPEQAYILTCLTVLPAGMLGLMVAAMFSATASMVDGEVNVFAGAITRDFYHVLIHPEASEKHLVAVGRMVTVLLGVLLFGVALAVPRIGGAEKIVLTFTGLLAGPMVLPTLWGLFSRKIGQRAIWTSTAVSFLVGAVIKFGLPATSGNGWLHWVHANGQVVEVAAGILVPLAVLFILEKTTRSVHPGYVRIQQLQKAFTGERAAIASSFPARLMAYGIGILALVMFLLVFSGHAQSHLLIYFSAILFLISAGIFWFSQKISRQQARAARQPVATE